MEETLTYTAQLALRKHSAEAIKKKVTLELRLGISFIIFLNVTSLPTTKKINKKLPADGYQHPLRCQHMNSFGAYLDDQLAVLFYILG